ncbi:MAG: hypothetical protein N2444_03770 [Methylocystis sp.]|nr:hypothetical protein [Methylocystis sp.]
MNASKIVRSHRALIAFAGLSALCAAPVFTASSAQAGDDKSTITTVMELVGVSSDETAATIDYSERPKLVLPPDRGALPEPSAHARPQGWPAEMAAERRRNADRYARIGGAEPEKKVGLLERIRGPRPTAAPGTDDEPGFLQRALSVRARADQPVWDEPSRRLLTEPPQGYRRPSQDLSKVRDTDGKKSSWWNPLSYLGGSGSDNDPVAQPGAPTPASTRAGGGAGNGGGGLLSSLGF